jgi:hypothetical protein
MLDTCNLVYNMGLKYYSEDSANNVPINNAKALVF